MDSGVDSGPNFLLDWHESSGSPAWVRAGIGTFLFHVLLLLFVLALSKIEAPQPVVTGNLQAVLRRVTPLVDPPTRLTQKAPSTNPVGKELSVENLTPRPPSKIQTPAREKVFRPPAPESRPKQTAAQRITEPPKIAVNTPQVELPAGVPKPPAPQIEPQEKPKLAFENPGQSGTSPQPNPALPKIPTPKTSVEEEIRSIARGGATGANMDQPPKLPGNLGAPPEMSLLSDPMGVDFRPYLARILALVRRNWFAILPESARSGDHGVVLLQFAIDRSGQVPKLVIATPSGTDALDRAAVAGISASVPFPPLPAEFKGREIRLQFSFKYNVR